MLSAVLDDPLDLGVRGGGSESGGAEQKVGSRGNSGGRFGGASSGRDNGGGSDGDSRPKRRKSIKQRHIEEVIAHSERFNAYASKNLRRTKGDMHGLMVVQNAVINIQRVMRGKIARQQYAALMDARYAIRDLLIFIVYLLLHVSFALCRKSAPDLYYLSTIMQDALIDEEFPGPPGGNTYILKTFRDVATIEEMWGYLDGPFTANVFPEACRADPSLGCTGAMNEVNFIVGSIRVRQFRSVDYTKVDIAAYDSTASPCVDLPPTVKALMPSDGGVKDAGCYGTWRKRRSDKEAFGPAATNFNATAVAADSAVLEAAELRYSNDVREGKLLDCFKYDEHNKGDEDDFFRNFFNSVPGGFTFKDYAYGWSETHWDEYPDSSGYTCLFHPELDPAAKLSGLQHFNWVDQSTRAVLVELAVYNRPSNLFSTMRLFFEFPRGGGIQVYYEPYTGFMYGPTQQNRHYGEWASLVLLAVFTLYFMLQELYEIWELGFAKWAVSLWNYMDMLNYMLFGYVFVFMVLASNVSFWSVVCFSCGCVFARIESTSVPVLLLCSSFSFHLNVPPSVHNRTHKQFWARTA